MAAIFLRPQCNKAQQLIDIHQIFILFQWHHGILIFLNFMQKFHVSWYQDEVIFKAVWSLPQKVHDWHWEAWKGMTYGQQRVHRKPMAHNSERPDNTTDNGYFPD